MEKRKVVYITGITGNIGRTLVKGLAGGYELRGSSRRGTPVPGAQVAAGSVTDGAFLREQLKGVDVVIHLAADPRPNATWESCLENNIVGTYELFEAARVNGVRRVVFASTNHVTGILTERWVPMDPFVPVRPDGYYGVSKAFGEVLGRYYADRFGISVINLRIGWYISEDEEQVVRTLRHRQDAYPLMWLSARDLIEVHRCAIEAPDDLLYGIYYAMSNNTGMLWDMSNARRELGYEPKDDIAEVFARHGVPLPQPPQGGGHA